MAIRHMEVEISNFSFSLLKVQIEKGIGLLVGEMTNKENIRDIKNMFYYSLTFNAGEWRSFYI